MAEQAPELEADGFGAEAGALPLGTVEWTSIDWATSDKLSTSLHFQWGGLSSELRLLETFPVSLLAGGLSGVLAIPGEANFAEASPRVSVAGVTEDGGDCDVDIQLLLFTGPDTTSLYQGPPLGPEDGYAAEPLLFSGQPFPSSLVAALEIEEVKLWLAERLGSTVDEVVRDLEAGASEMETARSGAEPGVSQGPPPGLGSSAEVLAQAAALAASEKRGKREKAAAVAQGLKPARPGKAAAKPKAVSNGDLSQAVVSLTSLVSRLESKVTALDLRLERPGNQGAQGSSWAPGQPKGPPAALPRGVGLPQQGYFPPPRAGQPMGTTEGQPPAGMAGQGGGNTDGDLGYLLKAILKKSLAGADGSLLDEENVTDSGAKGTAAMQRIVWEMRNNPAKTIANFEKRIMEDLKIYYVNQPWSVTQHSERHIEGMGGHRVLKKVMVMLSYIYDLCRVEGAPPRVQAAVGQMYKVSAETLACQGVWELTWPMTGLPDPDERQTSTATPSEKVAMVALAKERKMLKEAQAAALAGSRPTPKGKGESTGKPGGGGAAASEE